MSSPRWRILIIDDHPLVRRGLSALINSEPDLTVCAEAATSQAGLEAIASAQPDLVIADLSLSDGDGLSLVRNIRNQGGPDMQRNLAAVNYALALLRDTRKTRGEQR